MPTVGKRERFYKKIFLFDESIPTNDVWKKISLKVLDAEDNKISNKLDFPTNLTTVVISNDSERCVEYSFNGRDLDGELICDDGPFSQDCTSEGYLFFRLPEGTILEQDEKVQVRIWGWRGGTGR